MVLKICGDPQQGYVVTLKRFYLVCDGQQLRGLPRTVRMTKEVGGVFHESRARKGMSPRRDFGILPSDKKALRF